MFIKKLSLSIILLIFIISSCKNDSYHPNLLKPKTKNNYGEILFAIEKKYWSSELGKSIKNSFEKLEKPLLFPLRDNTI